MIIPNLYLGATEPTSEDHSRCDVTSQECEIGDPGPHLRLAAFARGKKRKSGIKIYDLTLEEVKAIAEDCNWQVYFSGPRHLQEDFKHHYNLHYSLKRFARRLATLQKEMEES